MKDYKASNKDNDKSCLVTFNISNYVNSSRYYVSMCLITRETDRYTDRQGAEGGGGGGGLGC